MEGIASYEQRTSETNNGPDKLSRIIIVDRKHSKKIQSKASKYPKFLSNELVTSKYTLLNFLPKNLFEQFRRLANFYFLIIALLQALSPSSPVGPSTSLIPLIFVVSTTAIKQAYEDYLRHKVDVEINRRLVCVLRDKKIIQIESKHIKVGDIVYITNNEEIPCDAILLASSCDDRCHVTTANLDGETNLKLRNCFQIKHQIGDIETIDESIFVIECDRPNATLYEFNGSMRATNDEKTASNLLDSWSPTPSNISTDCGASDRGKSYVSSDNNSKTKNATKKKKSDIFKSSTSLNGIHNTESPPSGELGNDCTEIGLDESNLLLRASRLKNTAHIYCLAIYTGMDTKLAHNSRLKPNKFSSIEHSVNKFLVVCFILLLAFSIIGTFMYKPMDVWYLNSISTSNERSDLLFLTHFLIFNYLVPISLYVTLEFVKFVGTLAVVNDKELRVLVYNPSDSERERDDFKMKQNATSDAFTKSYSLSSKAQPSALVNQLSQNLSSSSSKFRWENAKCNSSDLNEELGQVQVLFSDKTGTLTENHMVFRACTAFGSLYRSTRKQRLYFQPPEVEPMPVPSIVTRLRRTSTNRQALLSPLTPSTPLLSKSQKKSKKQPSASPVPSTTSTISSSGLSALMPSVKKLQLVKDISHNEKIVDFFTCIILCSTVHINETRPLEDCLPHKCANQYGYYSASPDEESLVSAAHRFGVTMCKSNDRECYIIINNSNNSLAANSHSSDPTVSKQNDNNKKHQQMQSSARTAKKTDSETGKSSIDYTIRRYERLCLFEFNSIRKRMSVIYRDISTGKVYMATKGSEEMLDCLKLNDIDSATERIVNVTLAYFEAFAKAGLRTLLVAKKILSQPEYDKIMKDVKDAMITVGTGRSQRLTLVHQRAETELTLIGATAVEDCLQDGVPETIADLKKAGIKVWLLTGDKVETATSVAYLCKLLDHEMIQFSLVRQQDAIRCGKLLNEYNQQVDMIKAKSLNGNRADISVATDEVSEKKLLRSTLSNNGQPYACAKTVKSGISEIDLDERFLKRRRDLKEQQNKTKSQYKFALIADGRSLYYAMKNHQQLLAKLCENCTSVLGCRLSPMQKAEIVRMIKDSPGSPVTAAIGDGANDVSMIQEAHVGIGISGKEGRQAVNSSDFAIGRFRLLRRLLFVHGHFFYVRSARTINYFFYKNMLFILPQFLYGFFNGFSGGTIYSPMMLIGYNVFFTSLPIFAYGLTEKHIPVKLLENFPRLYRLIANNSLMSTKFFLLSLMLAVLQASLVFYSMYHVWGSHTPFLESGKMAGIDGYSTILYFVVIFLVSSQLLLMIRSRSFWLNSTIILSVVSLPFVLYLHSLINWSLFNLENTASGQFPVFAQSFMFWFAILVLTALGLIPALILSVGETSDYYRQISDCLMY